MPQLVERKLWANEVLSPLVSETYWYLSPCLAIWTQRAGSKKARNHSLLRWAGHQQVSMHLTLLKGKRNKSNEKVFVALQPELINPPLQHLHFPFHLWDPMLLLLEMHILLKCKLTSMKLPPMPYRANPWVMFCFGVNFKIKKCLWWLVFQKLLFFWV